MPTLYKYKALTRNGTPNHGKITAENLDQVVDYLTEQNLIPIKVKVQRTRSPFFFLGFFKGTDYENLIVFTNNLATLYRAGIPLLRIMSILKIGPPHSRFNHAIQQERGLEQRLAHAEQKFYALTPARGRGKRQIADEETLKAAIEKIENRYQVEGLLRVEYEREVDHFFLHTFDHDLENTSL